MTATQTHYDGLLGPVYTWSAGGFDSALNRGYGELTELGIETSGSDLAVDLGSGFGMHSFPLARIGFRVLAIDSCKSLIDTVRERKGNLAIEVIHDDLLSFSDHLCGTPELILCMGDTLTHLADYREVEQLVASVASALANGGRFVVTFRDYTHEPTGGDRFIHVRSDAKRIHTCFLEYSESHVQVHDIVHERDHTGWTMRVSAYPKLRIPPTWFAELLRAYGLTVEFGRGRSGMVRISARREHPGASVSRDRNHRTRGQ